MCTCYVYLLKIENNTKILVEIDQSLLNYLWDVLSLKVKFGFSFNLNRLIFSKGATT